MTGNPLHLKFDGTVNLPLLGAVVAVVISGTLWVSSVNHRLDRVAELITAENNNRHDIDIIRDDLAKAKATSEDNNRMLKDMAK